MSDRTEHHAGGKLIVSVAGPVARITFNKPERMNAMSLDMWQGLIDILPGLAEDPEVRVLILDGAGERAFVSGADISEFDALRATPEGADSYNRTTIEASEALYDFPKPVIAAIKGYCVGGGLGIALCCDIRISADDGKLGITAAKLGLGYSFSEVEKVVQVAGPDAAARILFTGKLFPAEEMRAMGIVSDVVPRAGLDVAVADWADRIAAGAPMTARASKAAIRAVQNPGGPVTRDEVDRLVAACFASADYAEGRRAFAEKRKPVFRNR